MNKEAISLLPAVKGVLAKMKPSMAGLGGTMKGWAERAADEGIGLAGKTVDNTVKFLNTHPRAEEALRKITSYRFMDPANRMKNILGGSAISSAVSGTGTAAANVPSLFQSTREVDAPTWWNKNRKKQEEVSVGERFKNFATNTAIGTAAGIVPGAAVGRYGPRIAQRGLGRVLTNTVLPYFYNGKVQTDGINSSAKAVMRQLGETATNEIPKPTGLVKIKEMIKAIVRDKPMPHIQQEIIPGPDATRHLLFRDFFGLKNIHGKGHYLRQTGVDSVGGKIYQHDPHNPLARKAMKDLANTRAERFDSTNPNLLAENNGAGIARKDKGQLLWDPVMANVHADPKGNYADVWDFAMNGGEKIDSAERLGRALTSMFGTPSTIKGKTLTQSAALRRTNIPLSKIDPSFLSATEGGKSIAERVAKGTGAKLDEVQAYINSLSPQKQKKLRDQLANRMQGKDVNYLKAMAETEGVDLPTMRQLLGGRPSKARLAEDARRARSTVEGIKLSPENVQGIIRKRIRNPEDRDTIRDMINDMSPEQKDALSKSLRKWLGRGKSPEGFATIMQDRLGLGKADLV
jgi:hypothetical protein